MGEGAKKLLKYIYIDIYVIGYKSQQIIEQKVVLLTFICSE